VELGRDRIAGEIFLGCSRIHIHDGGLAERRHQLAIPDSANAFDLLRKRIAGLEESIPLGGSRFLDRGPGEAVHDSFFLRPGQWHGQKQDAQQEAVSFKGIHRRRILDGETMETGGG